MTDQPREFPTLLQWAMGDTPEGRREDRVWKRITWMYVAGIALMAAGLGLSLIAR